MKNLTARLSTIFLIAFALCVISPASGLTQPADSKKETYFGIMAGVPLAQDLSRQASFEFMGNTFSTSGELELDYGIGVAAVLGKRISDYFGVELSGSWSRQSSDLTAPAPAAALGQVLTGVPLENVNFAYDGRIMSLQSKIDLLLYPLPSSSIEPYIGGGAGIVRSDTEMDLVKDAATQGIIQALDGLGASGVVTEKIDAEETDYQLSLRAGVNIPFNALDIDLGWHFYRTYVEGKDNNSHVVAGIIKYAF